MREKRHKIKDFWWFNNGSCWLIKRYGFVSMYLYIPTMRYIYKTNMSDSHWVGTLYPHPLIMLGKERAEKMAKKEKHFESEHDAVRWLAGEKYVKTKKDK